MLRGRGTALGYLAGPPARWTPSPPQSVTHRHAPLIESARERLKGLLDVSELEAGLRTDGWLQRGIDGSAAADFTLGLPRCTREKSAEAFASSPREREDELRLTRPRRERRWRFERRSRPDSGRNRFGYVADPLMSRSSSLVARMPLLQV